MFSLINIFRIVAFLEGLSYILLLFIATPIKYFGDDPQYVKMLGMPHGILFMLYIVLAFMLKQENSWLFIVESNAIVFFVKLEIDDIGAYKPC